MLKKVTFLLAALLLATSASAQDKKPVTVADFVGTWNIEVMSHQIALVIEPAEGNKVTATMMMMGNDVLLKGELVERTIIFVGVPTGAPGAAHTAGPGHEGNQKPNAKPIVVTLQDDGMLAGEMMAMNGPVKWTGEKLKAKKKQ
jgi:hypothetical protein